MLLMQSYPNYCKYPTFQTILTILGHVNYLHIHVSTFIIHNCWQILERVFINISIPYSRSRLAAMGFQNGCQPSYEEGSEDGEKEKKERTSWG